MNNAATLRGLLARAGLRSALTYLAIGLLLAAGIALAGHDIARHADTVEAWISNLGPWAMLVFVGLFVVATTLLMPESMLSIMAGALFGLAWGWAVAFAAGLLAAALQYALSQQLLRARIQNAIDARPSLGAIQGAVSHSEIKLQVLLRLTPLNPATVSYLLGAAGVRFPGFMLACLVLAPHVFVEVYFGYVGSHVAHMAGRGAREVLLHDVVVIGGLAVVAVVIAVVSKMAHKAVMDAVAATAPGTPLGPAE